MLDIRLNVLLDKLATDQALDVEDGVEGVCRGLVLGSVSDELYSSRISIGRVQVGVQRPRPRSSSVKATYDGVIRLP